MYMNNNFLTAGKKLFLHLFHSRAAHGNLAGDFSRMTHPRVRARLGEIKERERVIEC